jgi:hypothetical protein
LKLLRQEYRPQGKERWLSPLTTGTLPNALRRLTSTTARPLSWATPGESANGWKSISGWLIREHQTAETDTLWSSYDTIKHVRVVPRTLLPAARRDGGDKVKAGTNSHLSEVNHFCMHRMYVTLSRMSCYARLVSVLRDPSRIATTFWLPLLLRCAGSTNIIPKRPVLSWSRCCAIGPVLSMYHLPASKRRVSLHRPGIPIRTSPRPLVPLNHFSCETEIRQERIEYL